MKTVFTARETSILIALLVLITMTTIKNPNFLFSADGFRDLLLAPAIFVVLAVGQAMVIITRNVDLSVGSISGALGLPDRGAVPRQPRTCRCRSSCSSGVLFGTFLGLVNGALVAFARVPSLVITLGTLYAYRGINVAWTAATASTPRTCPTRSSSSAPAR